MKQPRWFAIKAEVPDARAPRFVFTAQKTMYDGKRVSVGDTIFIFASENEGGAGLIARGTVTACEHIPRTAARQTPRISIAVARNGRNAQPLGRTQLRAFRGQPAPAPEAELDFKLYRQATNKVIGLSDRTGAFLDALF
ncbi:hypothetical protein EA655_01930 [Pseudoxanthomonas winnipegensis]|uniref:EVE domain-containing protein n=2 Tax=Pseudoxanthomonas winnipegensis TaxID=2480810 RepID=A0A4Q8MAH3_9GAMM|nr:hypothetical protein EA655_01930 [Pseudoxanthomonas winnipegensis]